MHDKESFNSANSGSGFCGVDFNCVCCFENKFIGKYYVNAHFNYNVKNVYENFNAILNADFNAKAYGNKSFGFNFKSSQNENFYPEAYLREQIQGFLNNKTREDSLSNGNLNKNNFGYTNTINYNNDCNNYYNILTKLNISE